MNKHLHNPLTHFTTRPKTFLSSSAYLHELFTVTDCKADRKIIIQCDVSINFPRPSFSVPATFLFFFLFYFPVLFRFTGYVSVGEKARKKTKESSGRQSLVLEYGYGRPTRIVRKRAARPTGLGSLDLNGADSGPTDVIFVNTNLHKQNCQSVSQVTKTTSTNLTRPLLCLCSGVVMRAGWAGVIPLLRIVYACTGSVNLSFWDSEMYHVCCEMSKCQQ